MKKKTLTIITAVLALVLLAEVGFLLYDQFGRGDTLSQTTEDPTTVPTTLAVEVPIVTTAAPTTQPASVPTTMATEAPTTEAPTEAPTEIPTEAPTEAPTEPPETEPGIERFTLSFAGNCVLGSTPSDSKNSASFVGTVGEDYGFPFRNVLEYFEKDDFTMVNLESVLADSGTAANKDYPFRGPSAYAKILTEGGVEAVSLANDHTRDFGKDGYDSTKKALEAEGVSYAEKDSSMLYTTDSGLKIGVYAVSFTLTRWDMQQEIKQLKKDGAEVIVVFFHWGEERAYVPNTTQINYAHMAIDNGADIVIGTNPHVLQRVETYKDGVICYSLGNFSYGGNKWPKDLDTAIIQQEVIRDESGDVSLGDMYIIPCSMTSLTSQNNFQPTPVEVGGWQYNQVLDKLAETPVYTGTGSAGTTQATTDATQAPAETPTAAPTEKPTEKPSGTESPDVPDLYDPQA